MVRIGVLAPLSRPGWAEAAGDSWLPEWTSAYATRTPTAGRGSSWSCVTPRPIRSGPRRPSKSWPAWGWSRWRGSSTASWREPRLGGRVRSACPTCARLRSWMPSPTRRPTGSRGLRRRSRRVGGCTRTSCSTPVIGGLPWRPSRASTGAAASAYCGTGWSRAAESWWCSTPRAAVCDELAAGDGFAPARRPAGAGRLARQGRPLRPAARRVRSALRPGSRSSRGWRCSAATAPGSRSCATCRAASGRSGCAWRRRRERLGSRRLLSPWRATTPSWYSPRCCV